MPRIPCICDDPQMHEMAVRALESAVREDGSFESVAGHYMAFAMTTPGPQALARAAMHWYNAAYDVMGEDLRGLTWFKVEDNEPTDAAPLARAAEFYRLLTELDESGLDVWLAGSREYNPLETFHYVFDICVKICRDDYTLALKTEG